MWLGLELGGEERIRCPEIGLNVIWENESGFKERDGQEELAGWFYSTWLPATFGHFQFTLRSLSATFGHKGIRENGSARFDLQQKRDTNSQSFMGGRLGSPISLTRPWPGQKVLANSAQDGPGQDDWSLQRS